MKLLVMSDSHGSVLNMNKAIKREEPDYVIFLGDCVRDFLKLCDEYGHINSYVVQGNCDYGQNMFPEVQTVNIGGKRFYITHGHRERVKTGYMTLCAAALEAEADIVLFGHTHRTYDDFYAGIKLFNPGSIGIKNYGIIMLENGDFSAELKCI